MPIFRHAHNELNPYAQISRNTLQDNKLSWAARGLLAYLLSLPLDWKISKKHLLKQSSVGKHGLQSIIQELEKFKYLKHRRVQDEKGRFKDWEYIIYERPYESVPKADLPKADFPTSGNPEVPKAEKPEIGQSAPTKEDIYTKEDKRRTKYSRNSIPTEFSPTARSLVDLFKSFLLFIKSDYKMPKSDKNWLIEMDRMLRIDKRKEQEIRELIEWLKSQTFWHGKIESIGKFRIQYDKLVLQMWNDPKNPAKQADITSLLDSIEKVLTKDKKIVRYANYVEAYCPKKPFSKFYFKSSSFEDDLIKFLNLEVAND